MDRYFLVKNDAYKNYYNQNKEAILARLKEYRTPEDGLCTIYRIYSSNKTYIGSTKMVPDLRFRAHMNSYNRYKSQNLGSYCASYQIFDEDPNATFEILEKTDIENKAEREAFYISHFKGLTQVVNIYEANKNSILNKAEYMRNYMAKRREENENIAFKQMCKIVV